jgi:phosphopantothenoylcysteine synthetase/decarboxylase
VNTINKWAAGIADTLALGLVVEGVGLGLPIVAIPYTNSAMAAHPAFAESIARLRGWGVTVLYGDDVVKLHPPGTGESRAEPFPWHLALDALPQP